MSKRPLLNIASLGDAAGEKTKNPVDQLAASISGKARTRSGKKQIQGYFDPDYRIRIKTLSAKLDRTVEDLLEEAMNDLFAKHNV